MLAACDASAESGAAVETNSAHHPPAESATAIPIGGRTPGGKLGTVSTGGVAFADESATAWPGASSAGARHANASSVKTKTLFNVEDGGQGRKAKCEERKLLAIRFSPSASISRWIIGGREAGLVADRRVRAAGAGG